MGADFSIKNSKFQVTVDLENNDAILAFKVKDRMNPNTDGFIHHKRYKYFQLPPLVKDKYKSVREFHNFLMNNQDKIELTNQQVVIDIEGQQVKIPFENQNQQSKIFCQMENKQRQERKKEILNSPQLKGGVNIILNLTPNGPNGNQKGGVQPEGNNQDYQNQERILTQIVSKINQKNSPNNPRDLSKYNLRSLIQILQEQFEQWQQKNFNAPNMNKKKTKQFDKQIQQLKTIIRQKQTQIIKLNAQVQIYKSTFTSFSPQKIIDVRKQAQQETKKKVIQQFLQDVSFHFNKLSRNSSKIIIKLNTKQSLLRQIDTIVEQIQNLRNQKKGLAECQTQILKYKDQINSLQKRLDKKNQSFISMQAFQNLQNQAKSLTGSQIKKIQNSTRI